MMKKPTSLLTRRFAGQSNLYSPALWKNVFRVLGLLVVIWGELGTFYWSLRGCTWPTFSNSKEGTGKKPAHVLLLSDTQVIHPLLQSRGEAWTFTIRRFFFDLNLKKNWHVTSLMKPDTIIFLGDMLANGKTAKNEASYVEAVQKFKKTFSPRAGVATYYVPGNNDISMGELTPVSKRVRGYFSNSFGPLNQAFDINNHTLVILNAPGVIDEDYQRRSVPFEKWTPIPDGALAFVKDIAEKRKNSGEGAKPMIFLSHIPLARPEMANCGPLREKGTIRRGVGHGYQSMVGRQTTTFLLKTLQPAAVFSGDNRDYCEFSHTNPDDAHSIREVTLKSFSMSVHIRRPGFQLLSIMEPPSHVPSQQDQNIKSTIADTPCFLPDQTKIYTSFYAPLFALTLLALFLFNFGVSRRSRKAVYRLGSLPPIRIGMSTSSSTRSSPVQLKTPSWSAYTPTDGPLSPRGGGSAIPGVLRMPHTATGFSGGAPSFRASSRPGTPGLGGLVMPESPFAYEGGGVTDDDDEDPMQPSQYSISRRETSQRRYHDDHDEEWSDIGGLRRSGSTSSVALKDEEEYDLVPEVEEPSASLLPSSSTGSFAKHNRKFSEFISAPDGGRRGPGFNINAERGWSWSFEFGGRRRRVSLRVPNVGALNNLVGLFQSSALASSVQRRTNVWIDTLLDMASVSWPAVLMWWFIVWCLS